MLGALSLDNVPKFNPSETPPGVALEAVSKHGRGMSVWEEQGVEAAVLEALHALGTHEDDGHHFGRPWVTAYQVAIAVHAAHPEIAQVLGVTIGGSGTGTRNSLAQYLARELSGRIKRDGDGYPVEGSFIFNEHLTSLTYQDSTRRVVTSSLTRSGYDLSLFRVLNGAPGEDLAAG